MLLQIKHYILILLILLFYSGCTNKNEEEIIVIFNEITTEIEKINLRDKIETLESKVSLNLDEKQYSELLSLRNQLKEG